MKKFICYNLWLGTKTFANTKLAAYFMCDTNTRLCTGCNYIGMIILHEVLCTYTYIIADDRSRLISYNVCIANYPCLA